MTPLLRETLMELVDYGDEQTSNEALAIVTLADSVTRYEQQQQLIDDDVRQINAFNRSIPKRLRRGRVLSYTTGEPLIEDDIYDEFESEG